MLSMVALLPVVVILTAAHVFDVPLNDTTFVVRTVYMNLVNVFKI
jgi:hypothetical protein